MWQPIDTAPKDGTPFLAINHDDECWVAKYTDDGRLCFRVNRLHEPSRHIIHTVDGKKLLERDLEYDAANPPEWRNDWCLWTRGYEFNPTHWMPLPPPPETTDDE